MQNCNRVWSMLYYQDGNLKPVMYNDNQEETDMYQYIFWDWNGTIIDDVGVALNAVNQMLQERDYPMITLQRYRELMNTPIIRFYEPIFDLEKYPFEEIADEFQRLYQEGNPKPYGKVPDLLQQFQEQGRHQIVLSSSERQSIQTSSDGLGFLHYFDAILGADDIYAQSKVDRAVEYLQQKKIMPEQCVIIGDTAHDYEVAHSMGIACVLLACGHDDEKSLRQCGCPVCENHQELSAFIFAKAK